MKRLIIAPHVDDELIGCFSVIDRGTTSDHLAVLYLSELTELRVAEAKKAAHALGFYPMFDAAHVAVEGYDEVYVPSRRDSHLAHRQANAVYREHATAFYSVEMGEGAQYLGEAGAERKRAWLEVCYPSQAMLWRNDARYYLFEHIAPRDYHIYESVSYMGFRVTVLEQYTTAVLDLLLNMRSAEHAAIFNQLLKLCPSGTVTMGVPNGRTYHT